MNKCYGDVLELGKFDINKHKLFSSLNEDDEVYLTREIINFILWSNEKIEVINVYLKEKNIDLYIGKKVNTKILVEFWLQSIGKSDRLENLLLNVDIIADLHSYVDKYYNKILVFNTDYDFKMISYTRYRTTNQYNEIVKLMNSSNYINNSINNFFKANKFNLDHIDNKNADLIIKKFSN